MHSRKFKIPLSFMRQSAAMLMASAMLLAIWMCGIEGALIPQVAQGQVVSGHVDKSSHEDDPNGPAPHSHGPSHSDESTDLCCTQVLAMRKSAFRPLVVEGPVAWQLWVIITGDSYGKRNDSLEGRIELARVPVEVHEANSYFFALPTHAPPLFS